MPLLQTIGLWLVMHVIIIKPVLNTNFSKLFKIKSDIKINHNIV